ncbi:hypothetical protein BH09ACT1_BH09ACT1_02590 [soil metagenome]
MSEAEPATVPAADGITADTRAGVISVVSGNPSSEELAAVTVVLEAMLDELDDAVAVEGPRVSAWQRSQRALRKPLHPGYGAWRSFSG